MKSIIRIFVFGIVFSAFLFMFSTSVSAQLNFDITNYDTHVVISEGNVFKVDEVIQVSFNSQSHGIFRSIPFKGTIYRDTTDAKYAATDYRVAIRNIAVENNKFSVSKAGDYVVIKIGDANTLVDGNQTYHITYDIYMGNDNITAFDEVYYNIIGDQWDTTIAKANFTVELPKPFDKTKLGIVYGAYGDQLTDNIKFKVVGNTITGSIIKPLSNYEGVTMRVELPQGYFIVTNPIYVDWTIIILIILATILCIFLFIRFGRDDKIVKTVEFNAPDGMTPSEIGYIYDGNVDNKDIVSLIIYWASKGYLTITQGEKRVFILNKIKNLDANCTVFEEYMFNELFNNRMTVSTSDLNNTFYTTVEKTRKMISNYFDNNNRRIFTNKSIGLKWLMSVITALPIISVLALIAYRELLDFTEIIIRTAIIGGLILVPVFFLIGTLRSWRVSKPIIRITKFIFFFALFSIAMSSFLYIAKDSLFFVLPVIAAIATVIIGLCAVFITKRTKQGTEWFGRILGLKEFIERAERDKLIELVNQAPNYFYDILPYAYVLGVTDIWAHNFESIAIEPPQWYQGYYGNFSPMLLALNLNHSMSSFQSQMTSRPAPKGGGGGFGGFSGGGFSGGGFGGGGGGSW